MMQYAATIVGIFNLMSVIAVVIALWLIAMVVSACVRRFSSRVQSWESYRIHLYVKSIYLCIILIGLGHTGSWLVSVYAGFTSEGHSYSATFALLLILSLLGPPILRMVGAFERSLQSGENFLRRGYFSVFGKLALALSLSAWIHICILTFSRYYHDYTVIGYVWVFGISTLVVWSLMLIVNDRWINYYLHSATPGAIHHSG